MGDEVKELALEAIRRDVPRDLFVDVQQGFPGAAQQADASVTTSGAGVVGGVVLSRKRQAKAVGLVRYQLLDELFEAAIIRHGGEFVSHVNIDVGSGAHQAQRVRLTTGRFGGTMIGFASHRNPSDAPVKNATRLALCSHNVGLDDDLFRPREAFTDRERFVLIMVRRDPLEIGKLASVSVGMVNSCANRLLFLESIEDILASYGVSRRTAKRGIILRRVTKRFKDKASGNDAGQAEG